MDDDDDIDMLLLASSPSKNLILNFMKGFSLFGAAQCLEYGDIEIAEVIMNDIIVGYQAEDHSIQ